MDTNTILNKILFHQPFCDDDPYKRAMVQTIINMLPTGYNEWEPTGYLQFLCNKMNDPTDNNYKWLRAFVLPPQDFSLDAAVRITKYKAPMSSKMIPLLTCAIAPPEQIGWQPIVDWITEDYSSVQEALQDKLTGKSINKVLATVPRIRLEQARGKERQLAMAYIHSYEMESVRKKDKLDHEVMKAFTVGISINDDTAASVGRMLCRLCVLEDIEPNLENLDKVWGRHPALHNLDVVWRQRRHTTVSAAHETVGTYQKSSLYDMCLSILYQQYKNKLPEAQAIVKDKIKQVNTLSVPDTLPLRNELAQRYGKDFPNEFFAALCERCDYPVTNIMYACCVPIDSSGQAFVNYLIALQQISESPWKDKLEVRTLKLAPKAKHNGNRNLFYKLPKENVVSSLKGCREFPIPLGTTFNYYQAITYDDSSTSLLYYNLPASIAETLVPHGADVLSNSEVINLPIIVLKPKPDTVIHRETVTRNASRELDERDVNNVFLAELRIKLPASLAAGGIFNTAVENMSMFSQEDVDNFEAFDRHRKSVSGNKGLPDKAIEYIDDFYGDVCKMQLLAGISAHQHWSDMSYPLYLLAYLEARHRYPDGGFFTARFAKELPEDAAFKQVRRMYIVENYGQDGFQSDTIVPGKLRLSKGKNLAFGTAHNADVDFLYFNCLPEALMSESAYTSALIEIPIWLPNCSAAT